MAAFAFDTSAIVKRYIQETGSSWVKSLADPLAGHELFLTRIGRVEITSAVTRRHPPQPWRPIARRGCPCPARPVPP